MVLKYRAAKWAPTFSPLPNVNQHLRFNVGIAIPAKNEEHNIEYVLSGLKGIGYRNVLVIDGLSSDGTLKVAARNGAKIVLQDGCGKGAAVRQVLSNDYLSADALVLMDADGSMSPQEVPRFVEALRNGADVVKGSRFVSGGGSSDMTIARRIGNSLFTMCVNLLWAADYTDMCYGFVAFSQKAIRKLAPVLESNNFEIETELFIKAKKLGLKVVEVPSFEYSRKSGASNLHSLRDGFKILRTILLEAIRN
ncbi:MAG: glycosyltransferase family 2 protein [Candidatus Bathyarchaeota archaeon]|nr:glycosyltransferase family 2 protein [Candidatus Bathyarchaeota archaeon]